MHLLDKKLTKKNAALPKLITIIQDTPTEMEMHSPNAQNCVDYINMTCIKLKRSCVLPLDKCLQPQRHHSDSGMNLTVLPVSHLAEVLSAPVLPSQRCLHTGAEKHFETYTKKNK